MMMAKVELPALALGAFFGNLRFLEFLSFVCLVFVSEFVSMLVFCLSLPQYLLFVPTPTKFCLVTPGWPAAPDKSLSLDMLGIVAAPLQRFVSEPSRAVVRQPHWALLG